MRNIITVQFFLIAMVIPICSIQSLACSLFRGYLPPSNYELIRDTESIVLAEAKYGSNGKIHFSLLKVIKGSFGKTTFQVEGHAQYRGKSKVGDFSRARPGAYAGSCVAYDYKIGSKFLLLLNQDEGSWRVSPVPFGRVNEEICGKDSPWFKTVSIYTKICELNDYEMEKRSLLKILSMKKEYGDYPGLISDIQNHLETPHHSKSFKDLEEMYEKATSDTLRRRNVLWAFAEGKHPQAKSLVGLLIRSNEWSDYIDPISEYFRNTADVDMVPVLANVFLKMKGRERWSIGSALIGLACEKHKAQMLEVLLSANEKEAVFLSTWFASHPSNSSLQIYREQHNGEYVGKWELTLALSGMGDIETLAWASRFMETTSDDRWKSFHAIARSPLPDADLVAQGVLSGTDTEGIVFLVQGYAKSLHDKRSLRLIEAMKRFKGTEIEHWAVKSLHSEQVKTNTAICDK